MHNLNSLTFEHEDLAEAVVESSIAVDGIAKTIDNTFSIEQLNAESALSPSETEAAYLVTLTKSATDLKTEPPAPNYSDTLASRVMEEVKKIEPLFERVKDKIKTLSGLASEVDEKELREQVALIDFANIPEDVVADLSYATVSTLHAFHFGTLHKFLTEAVDAARKGEHGYLGYPEETVSLLGQYSVSTTGWGQHADCFVKELASPVHRTNTNEQEPTKELLIEILLRPLPESEHELTEKLDGLFAALKEVVDLIQNAEGDIDYNTANIVFFAHRLMSVISCWGFIYGTVRNTLVRLYN